MPYTPVLPPNPYPYPHYTVPDYPYIWIDGSENDDVLVAYYPDDFIFGYEGNDTLTGKDGENWIYGGDGNDRIYGAGGNDPLDGEAGDDQVFGEAGHDIASGGDGNDQVFGGEGDDYLYGDYGDDLVDGGVGRDIVSGGHGVDRLTGGAGADVFLYGDRFDSYTRVYQGVFIDSADRIADFSQAQGDIIDLSVIDADTTTAGDQAFRFIGAAPFTGVAGQLRAEISGGVTVVTADFNGDGSADFDLEIRLTGAITLTMADFVL